MYDLSLQSHKNVDIIIVRQNTEGEYSLEEHEVRFVL